MTDENRIYSPSRVADGPLLFVSGQVPIAADGRVPDDFGDQVRLVADNIVNQLADHDADWEDVVRLTYYLRDMDDLDRLRAIMLDTLGDSRPAASLVEVSALVDPRFRLEIDAVAQLPST